MRIFNVEITPNMKEVLEKGRIENEFYYLPNMQLNRQDYVENAKELMNYI
jgi:hypothetical protein